MTSKKINELAAKTGMTGKDSSSVLKLGLLGGILLALGAFCACVKGGKAAPAKPAHAPVPPQKQTVSPLPSAPDSAPERTAPDFWKNYPAGTRYNTASPLDFTRAA